jgi:hypothetical protein
MPAPGAPPLAVLGLALLLPAGGAAQACGLVAGSGVDAAAGYVRYDLGNGTAGPAVGADLTIGTPVVSARAGYRRFLLDAAAEPDVGRLAIAAPVGRVDGVTICPVAHGGASRVSLGIGTATIAVGGIGLRIAGHGRLGTMAAVSFVEVRGLAANTTGTVFGTDVDAVGYSLGGAAGVQMSTGALTLRLEGALDGLDDGLGPTPYPDQSVELGLGIRF